MKLFACIASAAALCAASQVNAQIIWDSGAPHPVIFNGTLTNLGFSSGNLSATQPQRWAVMPFSIPAGGRTIHNVDADYFCPAGFEVSDIGYKIFNREGLNVPNQPDYSIVNQGFLGPHDPAGLDDPRIDGVDNFLHRFTGLSITLPAGDYWFSIFGDGIGQGNTTGFSNAAWFTGADLVPTALERNGMWRSSTYPSPGFVEGANAAIQPNGTQDPNDCYNCSYTLYGEIIPAPGAVTLLALGLGFASRRRR